jgi:hypothetical protein
MNDDLMNHEITKRAKNESFYKNNNRMIKSAAYFFNDIKNTTIKQYFGIKDDNLTIKLYHPQIDTFLLEFKYFKSINTNVVNFRNLPDEISKKINSYLYDYINVIFKIKYKDRFYPPISTLFSLEYNILKPYINIKKYYKYLINKHNGIYNNYNHWTSALTIRTTVLEIITMMQLNHFQYLLEHDSHI